MSDRNYIISLERGIKVLELFSSFDRGLTLTEVAKQLKMNKTSTKRFLYSFYTLGYLTRDEHKQYSLTSKVLTFGFGYLNSSNLRSIGRQYIDQLSTELKRTVNLTILDSMQVLYLYRKEVVKYLKYDLYDGSKLPVYCTSSGKVLLAGLNDEELKAEIDQMDLKPITPMTITSKKTLWNEVKKINNRGYTISDRELSMDLGSVAAPVFGAQGKIMAAVSVTFKVQDKNESLIKAIWDNLLVTCESISKRLGS